MDLVTALMVGILAAWGRDLVCLLTRGPLERLARNLESYFPRAWEAALEVVRERIMVKAAKIIITARIKPDFNSAQEAITRRKIQRTLAVSSMHLRDRQKHNAIATTIMASIALVHFFLHRESTSTAFLTILFTYGAVLWIDEALLSYRIRKGIYGGNEFEAREILEYIASNSDRFDSGDAQRIRIFDDAEKEETGDVIVPGGEVARG